MNIVHHQQREDRTLKSHQIKPEYKGSEFEVLDVAIKDRKVYFDLFGYICPVTMLITPVLCVYLCVCIYIKIIDS